MTTHKAGEWADNHLVGSQAGRICGQSQAEANASRAESHEKMRSGPPQATPEFSADQLKGMGYVGLYWKEDSPAPTAQEPRR
jgi:hypothetical protein